MIVGACGFGSTGSSVITDYLGEFGTFAIKDDLEFTWVSSTDGLLDLEQALMHPRGRTMQSIVAFQRFEAAAKKKARSFARHGLPPDVFLPAVQRFIDAITMAKWPWYDPLESPKWRYRSRYFFHVLMKRKIIPRLELKLGRHATCWPLKEVRYSAHPANYYEEAKKMVMDILSAMTNGAKDIALDQPFPGNNPQACFPYFDDPYAIVVDRDPRDNYVFARTRMLGKFHYVPINRVEDYIAYYRALRKDQPYLEDHPRVLRIRFEDMVYEYEKTSAKVREFLKLPENPAPKSIFDPALSIANTQVFRRFPQFADDVAKIERELPEYLFDYSKYPPPDPGKKMFYGKSPKHARFKKEYSE